VVERSPSRDTARAQRSAGNKLFYRLILPHSARRGQRGGAADGPRPIAGSLSILSRGSARLTPADSFLRQRYRSWRIGFDVVVERVSTSRTHFGAVKRNASRAAGPIGLVAVGVRPPMDWAASSTGIGNAGWRNVYPSIRSRPS